MLTRKVPSFYLLIFAMAGSTITYFTENAISKSTPADIAVKEATVPANSCDYNIMRLSGYKYIRPFLHAEPQCESGKYQGLKTSVMQLIDNAKAQGVLQTATVYLCDLSKDEWMSVSPEEKFHPGSLFKVVTLITYLRMAETEPGILNMQYHYDENAAVHGQYYSSKSIVAGKNYTVKELLHYMIAYSDNKAAFVLQQHANMQLFRKIFADLGLKVPSSTDKEYFISAQDYSEFLRALYDGTYLTINASEYATSLLSECDFNKGIVAGLPANVKVAHKFGESGTDQVHELHESAIVYLDNNPYLLTVMTSGPNLDKMTEVISLVSKLTYERMSSKM